MPMTFDGRARNRYVNFSRDVVRSAERVNLNRIATPLRRVIRPPRRKIYPRYVFTSRKNSERQSKHSSTPNPTTNGKGSKRVAVC